MLLLLSLPMLLLLQACVPRLLLPLLLLLLPTRLPPLRVGPGLVLAGGNQRDVS